MNKIDYKFSIVVPSYNEAANLKKGKIREVFTFLKDQKFSYEVLFVNDGSTDNTLSLLKELIKRQKNAHIYSIPHAGKMAAVREGVMKARGEYVLFTDFDQSTPITEILKVLNEFKNGADVVIARRKKVYDWPLPQRVRSRIFNLLVQFLILPGFADTQCGFKAFRTSIGKELFSKLVVTNDYQKGRYMGAFDVELLFLAKKFKYKIKSIDVSWYCVRAGKVALTEPLRMFRDILSIRIYDLLGYYDRILDRR